MKIPIEEYKGQAIEYDDDYDKFVCDISIEDKFKTAKRASLKDLRSEIDQFIKLNLDFKPFKALWKDYDSPQIRYIQAIRTDGKLVVSDKLKEGYKSHVGAKESTKLFVFDADIISELDRIENERKEQYEAHKKKIAELVKKLVPIDFSKYDLK